MTICPIWSDAQLEYVAYLKHSTFTVVFGFSLGQLHYCIFQRLHSYHKAQSPVAQSTRRSSLAPSCLLQHPALLYYQDPTTRGIRVVKHILAQVDVFGSFSPVCIRYTVRLECCVYFFQCQSPLLQLGASNQMEWGSNRGGN